MKVFPDILLLIGVASLLEFITILYFSPRWSLRAIELFDTKNKAKILTRIALYSMVGSLFGFWYKDILAGISFTAITWLAIIAVFTDFKYCRIPIGACWTSLGITFLMVIFALFLDNNKTALISAIVALISVLLSGGLLALLTKGKFGSGDVRLMLALSVLAAWSGYVALLIGLILASIIQLPLRIALRKYGKSTEEGLLPFAPALIIGTLVSILIFGHPGAPINEFGIIINK